MKYGGRGVGSDLASPTFFFSSMIRSRRSSFLISSSLSLVCFALAAYRAGGLG